MGSTMRNAMAVVALALTVKGASAAPVTLPERTTVRVRLLQTLVSGAQKKGEEVHFEVTEDVLGPHRELLIARGTPAFGTIQRSSGRGMFGKSGKLEFSIDGTRAVDGTAVSLRGAEADHGRDNTGTVVAGVVLLGPLGGLIHGRNVKIEPGTEFTAYVDRDTGINPNGTAAAVAPLSPAPASVGKSYTLILKNGDSVTGTLRAAGKGAYKLATAEGPLTIPMADVTACSEK